MSCIPKTYPAFFVEFLGFIGLGIPDSLFGAAWSVIYPKFGLLADWVGADLFPWFLAVLFVALILCMVRLIAVLKQRGRYE